MVSMRAKEFFNMRMETGMKEISCKISIMEKDYLPMQMEKSIMEILQIIK